MKNKEFKNWKRTLDLNLFWIFFIFFLIALFTLILFDPINDDGEIDIAQSLDHFNNILTGAAVSAPIVSVNETPILEVNETEISIGVPIEIPVEEIVEEEIEVIPKPVIIGEPALDDTVPDSLEEEILPVENFPDNSFSGNSSSESTDSVKVPILEQGMSIALDTGGGQLSISSNDVENVTLNSTYGANLTTENLTVYYDLTNESAKGIVNWYMNGISLTVLNMPFENNTANPASTTKDYSPYGNNGTINGVTWNRTGGYDGKGAYEFDGGSDYINIGNDASTNSIVNAITIEAWVYPKADGNYRYILSND
ncbi:MAG: hypothetical protein ABIG93_00700, partial [archaeon]